MAELAAEAAATAASRKEHIIEVREREGGREGGMKDLQWRSDVRYEYHKLGNFRVKIIV